MNDFRSDCLIVGAGPAGLMLACLLASYGVMSSVIETRKTSECDASRATGLRSGTLNILKYLGLLDHLISQSRIVNGMRIYRNCQAVGFVKFTGTERYPVDNLSVEQTTLQTALLNRAIEAGVDVHFGCELLEVKEQESCVSVLIRNEDSLVWRDFRYLVGADGAHSVTRRELGISFEGEVDPSNSFVADCAMHGGLSPSEMHYFINEDSQRLAIIPLPGEANRFKLSGNLPRDFDTSLALPEIETRLKELVRRLLDGQHQLESIENFSSFHLASRLAAKFATSRCFLVGDAARICLPNGGWGLNSAIADAANLAWKLAGTMAGWCDVQVLQTYGRERRAVSEMLLVFTKRRRAAAFSARPSDEEAEETFSPVLTADGFAVLEDRETCNTDFPLPGSNVFERGSAELWNLANAPVGGKFSIFTSFHGIADDEKNEAHLTTALARIGFPINETSYVWPESKSQPSERRVAIVRPDGVVGATGSGLSECLPKYFGSISSKSGLRDVVS